MNPEILDSLKQTFDRMAKMGKDMHDNGAEYWSSQIQDAATSIADVYYKLSGEHIIVDKLKEDIEALKQMLKEDSSVAEVFGGYENIREKLKSREALLVRLTR